MCDREHKYRSFREDDGDPIPRRGPGRSIRDRPRQQTGTNLIAAPGYVYVTKPSQLDRRTGVLLFLQQGSAGWGPNSAPRAGSDPERLPNSPGRETGPVGRRVLQEEELRRPAWSAPIFSMRSTVIRVRQPAASLQRHERRRPPPGFPEDYRQSDRTASGLQ